MDLEAAVNQVDNPVLGYASFRVEARLPFTVLGKDVLATPTMSNASVGCDAL